MALQVISVTLQFAAASLFPLGSGLAQALTQY